MEEGVQQFGVQETRKRHQSEADKAKDRSKGWNVKDVEAPGPSPRNQEVDCGDRIKPEQQNEYFKINRLYAVSQDCPEQENAAEA
ncbi:MAG: hypothetical protein DMG24_10620 [Acidobacteria bacterium]|nr:MAG: hypothetical protein DMG24_10620 [Acidobacteriota bacterium]